MFSLLEVSVALTSLLDLLVVFPSSVSNITALEIDILDIVKPKSKSPIPCPDKPKILFQSKKPEDMNLLLWLFRRDA